MQCVRLINAGPLLPCTFVKRVSRVSALIRVGGHEEPVKAHLTNTGKLLDILREDSLLWCTPLKGIKTSYRIIGKPVDLCKGALIDTGMQERAFSIAVQRGVLKELAGWEVVKRGPSVGNHRLDFELERNGEKMYVEIKSAVFYFPDDRSARYPDTITVRGQAHLKLLIELFRSGVNVALVFIAAHPYAEVFKPHDADPEIRRLVKIAIDSKLPVFAYRFWIDWAGIVWVCRKPLRIEL